VGFSQPTTNNVVLTNGLGSDISLTTSTINAQYFLNVNNVSSGAIVVSSINGLVFPQPASGVTSLNTLTGTVQITATNLNVNTAGTQIVLSIPTTVLTNVITPVSPVTKVSIPTLDIASPDSSITFGTSGNQITAVVPKVKQATYYKTTRQNLVSGNTVITFDGLGSWNNVGGYITHVSGSTDFTVVQTGLYQLEFNALIIVNSGAWVLTNNKTVNILIARSPIVGQAILQNTSIQGVQSYSQSVVGTYYLVAGDVITTSIGNIYTGTPVPQAECLTNTFDLNTFFTWTYISS
jgi:hypothetical protein